MNAREQRLLALFLLALVLGGSFLAWRRVAAAIGAMRAESAGLARQAEIDASLTAAYGAEMQAANQWLDQRLGEPIADEEALSQLLKAAQDSAREAGLDLKEPQFRPPERRGRMSLARIGAQVSGPESAIYPWLVKFHAPEQLRSVLSVTIRPDKADETAILCEMELARWFIAGSTEPEPES
jgi:hypothetical protein